MDLCNIKKFIEQQHVWEREREQGMVLKSTAIIIIIELNFVKAQFLGWMKSLALSIIHTNWYQSAFNFCTVKSRSNVRPQGRQFGLDWMRTRACAPTEEKIVEVFFSADKLNSNCRAQSFTRCAFVFIIFVSCFMWMCACAGRMNLIKRTRDK